MSALADVRFRLAAAAFLLLLSSFVMPRFRVSRPIYDVVAVLDITTSMTVRDVMLDGAPASRLAMEKRAAGELLGAMPCGSRLGIALFVERVAFLLFSPIEVCENYAPLAKEIAALDWRMGWDSESHIAIGLHNAMQMAHEQGADLIFMTDGQEMPPLWWTGPPDFHDVAGKARGVVAGVGDDKLSPVPKYDIYGREIGTWKPGELPSEKPGQFSGHEHLSSVDTAHLKSLAAETGLRFVRLTSPTLLFPTLQAAAERRVHETLVDLRYVPATLSLMLLAVALSWPQARAKLFGQAKGLGQLTNFRSRDGDRVRASRHRAAGGADSSTLPQ